MLILVKVDRINLDTKSNRYIVFLSDDANNRSLPIVTGTVEANAIALQLKKTTTIRPLIHETLANLVKSANAKIVRVVIDKLQNGSFHSIIVLHQNDQDLIVEARPSDSIALALQVQAPIFVSEDILKQVGISKK